MKRILLAVLAVVISSSICFAKEQSYEDWLEKYSAYDQLEREITKTAEEETPDLILKKAKVYLQLGSPNRALEIIEMTPAFDDNATEATRLWYGGQAHRALGDLSKAVLWFTQSAKVTQSSGTLRSRFRNEPDLDTIWQDVWTHMYWTYTANYTISRRTQLNVLKDTLEAAKRAWSDSFWDHATSVCGYEESGNATLLPEVSVSVPSSKDADGKPIEFITAEDKMDIAQGLAALSLETPQQAALELAKISSEPVRVFWVQLAQFLETGERPTDLEIYEKDDFLKARAFWSGHILAPYSSNRQEWLLGNPDAGAWTQFRNKILGMSADTAQQAIDKELGSMLISEQTAALLRNFKFALTLMNGDIEAAKSTWESMDRRKLPISLQVAGLVAFGASLNTVMPDSPAKAARLYPVLTALTGAAGNDLRPGIEAPFWAPISQSGLRRAAKSKWPLDKLVLLAYWQKELNQKPRESLAKRAAFVFSDTSFGINSLLYLADQAISRKNMVLASFYLNRLNPDKLSNANKARWLEVKTRMELNSGKQDRALATYKKLTSTGEEIPSFTKLRMALLMQQRGELGRARDQLLELWKDHENMTTAMQAEILFWLGEGEQAMKNHDSALNYYLKLAYQYPQENIWALTAMYRASMIYESRGNFQTAKKLLKTVIKNADTKEQREAAKARLSAIDSKTGGSKRSQKSKTDGIVYPF